MKKILLLVCSFALITMSCEKDNGLLDPNAMISLRPAQEVRTSTSNPKHLTGLEIVEQADGINFYNREVFGDQWVGRGFSEKQRDLVNVRLLMFGTDIISSEGNYVNEFIEGEDVVLIRAISEQGDIDTIGYVKNSTLRDAEARIKEAFTKEDYEACYDIFDEAFTFLPITGEEWRTLKEQGIN